MINAVATLANTLRSLELEAGGLEALVSPGAHSTE
jgi:hypothetical protein